MSDSTSNGMTPPGWYQDAQGTMRWWDGTGWTENTQPPATGAPASPHPTAAPTPTFGQAASYATPSVVTSTDPERPWFKKKRWWAAGAAALLVIAAAAGGSDSGDPTAQGDSTPGASSSPDPKTTSKSPEPKKSASTKAEPAKESTKKPDAAKAQKKDDGIVKKSVKKVAESLGQANAVSSAESYLEFSAFSRSGLIKQLEFEGYSKAEATYAVDKVDPDWNEQAAASAKAYLEMSAFSRASLIQQLEFEGFTSAQAAHGATAAGY